MCVDEGKTALIIKDAVQVLVRDALGHTYAL